MKKFKCTDTVTEVMARKKDISFEIDNNERAKFSAACCLITLGIGCDTYLNQQGPLYSYFNDMLFYHLASLIQMYNVVYHKVQWICSPYYS